MIKLGVNIDHVATLRQARGGKVPDPVRAAREAERGGADGITVHLREDRRHIQDSDLPRLKRSLHTPLNLEMSIQDRIVKIACRLRPEKACLVPERRREVTTEGGLDVKRQLRAVTSVVRSLQQERIQVSLFIDPKLPQVRAAKEIGTDAIELHTGAYANAEGKKKEKELFRLRRAARVAHQLGLKVHAGHGLDYENVGSVAKIPHVQELNIGHSIVSRSLLVGMRGAVAEMKRKIRG